MRIDVPATGEHRTMDTFIIEGGAPLSGSITVEGLLKIARAAHARAAV
jgi:hypothetical protein